MWMRQCLCEILYSPSIFFAFLLPCSFFHSFPSFWLVPLMIYFSIHVLAHFPSVLSFSKTVVWNRVLSQNSQSCSPQVQRQGGKQVGCLFVQHRLHLFIQPQPFFQCFHFSHSSCLLKIGICITRIYLSNLFSFKLFSETRRKEFFSFCCQEKWLRFQAGDGKFGRLAVAVKEAQPLGQRNP